LTETPFGAVAVDWSVVVRYARGVPRSGPPGAGIPSCRDCILDWDGPGDTSDCTEDIDKEIFVRSDVVPDGPDETVPVDDLDYALPPVGVRDDRDAGPIAHFSAVL
jgi:hypothetical protein